VSDVAGPRRLDHELRDRNDLHLGDRDDVFQALGVAAVTVYEVQVRHGLRLPTA